MAIVFTYGVGFATGIMFGPIHQITPFMLLGIGTDDMFVMMEAVRQLSPQERALCVAERIGLALKHAGVSITVTSITDIEAFAIGGSTASSLTFRHVKCTSSICNIQAMDEIREMTDQLSFNSGGHCFVYSNPQ
ncbi:hypothetical protein DPMN_092707 [Dreissena polymorpha]|uniref:SSD domain-containing protein n=1 Tax=Dreissena polymorpha TaxID=45954 RepID=A0A9D4L2V7_DREPO|nr:hypothetical protein DPMN_092707 [Dreissena polymorpha]